MIKSYISLGSQPIYLLGRTEGLWTSKKQYATRLCGDFRFDGNIR